LPEQEIGQAALAGRADEQVGRLLVSSEASIIASSMSAGAISPAFARSASVRAASTNSVRAP
jgi:uncharacterized membrane protein